MAKISGKNTTIIVAASSFATSNPLGGHYRSAAAIAELLCDDYDVVLLNPGTRPSPVMRVDGIETVFLEGSPERPAQLRSEISSMMELREARAVLAFDQKAGELIRPLARRMKAGFVLVKAGGGQPKLYYPDATHNIVFMAADQKWLEERNLGQHRVLKAAGRVYEPPQDLDAQAALRAETGLSESDLAIVRVGRIAPHYGAVNRSALALGAQLRNSGLPARVILIGTPDNAQEFDALSASKGPADAILCDPRYTDRASKLLGMFRFCVGTGRGFMEAASMGHVMFCGSQDPDHDLPLLVTEENFQRFANDNFSPRIKPDVDRDANLARILETMKRPELQGALSASARGWYRNHFSAQTSRQAYIDMIEDAIHRPEHFGIDHLFSEIHLRFSVLQDRMRKHFVG